MAEPQKIKSVSDFINVINEIVDFEDIEEKENIVVFRGETQDFGKSKCIPNIFRKPFIDKNKMFEKNLFDEMSANGIAVGNNYLEKAVSAQHDGFPSRLLDVSYNCLVALYFACTPYYFKPEDSKDEVDGYVYIFTIEKMFCPTANNIIDNYNDIIENKKDSFITYNLFGMNHKLIDHIRSNKRIIAQQGAFILFQGDEYQPIPDRLIKTIEIPSKSKKRLRRELKELFGIYTGSIYPQADNLISYIEKKTMKLETFDYNFENEVELSIENFKDELQFYLDKIYNEEQDPVNTILPLEKTLKKWYFNFKQIYSTSGINDHEKEILNDYKNNYITLLKDFDKAFLEYAKKESQFYERFGKQFEEEK